MQDGTQREDSSLDSKSPMKEWTDWTYKEDGHQGERDQERIERNEGIKTTNIMT